MNREAMIDECVRKAITETGVTPDFYLRVAQSFLHGQDVADGVRRRWRALHSARKVAGDG